MKLFNQYWKIMFAVILAGSVLWPILNNTWFPMHDSTHVARIYLMEKTIFNGQFPPIWAEGINNGFGYPLFHLYAPLFYYLALATKMLVGDYFVALKIVLATFLVVGVTGVMQLAKKWGRVATILSGVLFATSPYLAVDLYVRGAFAELAALCLLPWVFYTWQDLSTPRKQVFASISATLFFISHNLIPFLVFPMLAVWVIANHFHNIKLLIMPILLTFFMSAFFLLPLVFERSFVQAETIAKTSDYSLHFVAPWQLWNSTWGFGGSAPGVEDGFSFKLGKLQLLFALVGSIALFLRKKKYSLLSGFTIFSLIMTTSAAILVWKLIPMLQLAQFPWRYLALTTSLLAVVGAYTITLIPLRPLRIGIALIAVALLLFTNLKYFAPQSTFVANQNDYTSDSYLSTLTSIIPEYMPTWIIESNSSIVGTNTISRAYYPTWIVKVDGSKVNTFPSESGLLSYYNPNNSNNITYYQSHTSLEYLGYALTIFGIILSIYYFRQNAKNI